MKIRLCFEALAKAFSIKSLHCSSSLVSRAVNHVTLSHFNRNMQSVSTLNCHFECLSKKSRSHVPRHLSELKIKLDCFKQQKLIVLITEENSEVHNSNLNCVISWKQSAMFQMFYFFNLFIQTWIGLFCPEQNNIPKHLPFYVRCFSLHNRSSETDIVS